MPSNTFREIIRLNHQFVTQAYLLFYYTKHMLQFSNIRFYVDDSTGEAGDNSTYRYISVT